MNRRVMAALALAVLTALTGCAGFLSNDTTTATATPGANNTTTPGPGAQGQGFDTNTVLERHASQLDAAETFTYRENLTRKLLDGN